MPKRCLLLYVEPTPYILPRLAFLQADKSIAFDWVFITQNKTQPWRLECAEGEVLFANGRVRGMGRWLRLLGKITTGRYDAAHLAGWGHPVLLTVIAAFVLRRVPFSMESDTPVRQKRFGPKEWIKCVIYPWLFRQPRMLLPGGERQARYFRQFAVPAKKIRKAYMTVDTNRIRTLESTPKPEWRRRNGLRDDDVVFLYVGRLEERKGVRCLLHAFQNLRRNPPVRLIVIGDGSLRQLVEGAAAKDSAITYLQRQPFESVVQWMRASDVLVLPSLFEPWGLVVNEAMACGLPVVATKEAGAVDDLVFDGLNGLVISAGDVGALTGAMGRLVNDPVLRRRMGESSSHIIAPWTAEREAAVVGQAIKEMLETPGPTSA